MTDSQSTPPNAAAGSADHTAVGALLRQSRERAGLNVADAARALRISQKYLEALEDGRHADLPGTAYAIGFVRSYAEHLHLDSEEIVRRYKDEAAGVGTKNDLVFPKPIADGGVPGGAVLGLGVMVAALAYGVWYWNSNNTEVEIARVEAVPEHMAVAGQSAATSTSAAAAAETVTSPESAADAAEDRTPDVSSPVEASPDEDKPVEITAVDETPVDVVVSAQDPVVQAPVVDETMAQDAAEEAVQVVEAVEQASKPEAQPQPEPAAMETAVEAVEPEVEEVVASIAAEQPAVETAPQAAEQPATETAPQTTESAVEETVTPSVETASAPPTAAVERQNDGPSRITVRAKSNSWIQVRDEIADRLLFTRLLREGQEYQVPNRDGLRLMTGNAGALELLVDGSVVPAIGDVGEVRRNVELDVDKLQSGSAVSE